MKLKLFISDMDGSLLDEHKQLPKNIDETVEELLKQGLELTIASGRSYVDIIAQLEKWADKIGVIAENGNQIK